MIYTVIPVIFLGSCVAGSTARRENVMLTPEQAQALSLSLREDIGISTHGVNIRTEPANATVVRLANAETGSRLVEAELIREAERKEIEDDETTFEHQFKVTYKQPYSKKKLTDYGKIGHQVAINMGYERDLRDIYIDFKKENEYDISSHQHDIDRAKRLLHLDDSVKIEPPMEKREQVCRDVIMYHNNKIFGWNKNTRLRRVTQKDVVMFKVDEKSEEWMEYTGNDIRLRQKLQQIVDDNGHTVYNREADIYGYTCKLVKSDARYNGIYAQTSQLVATQLQEQDEHGQWVNKNNLNLIREMLDKTVYIEEGYRTITHAGIKYRLFRQWGKWRNIAKVWWVMTERENGISIQSEMGESNEVVENFEFDCEDIATNSADEFLKRINCEDRTKEAELMFNNGQVVQEKINDEWVNLQERTNDEWVIYVKEERKNGKKKYVAKKVTAEYVHMIDQAGKFCLTLRNMMEGVTKTKDKWGRTQKVLKDVNGEEKYRLVYSAADVGYYNDKRLATFRKKWDFLDRNLTTDYNGIFWTETSTC